MREDDERFSIIKRLLLDHVSQPSERQVRDGLAVYMLAGTIIERLDHRTSVWRKWNQEREDLLRSASQCWIPLEDMRTYLNGMPGPELTRMDVAQRMRAFHEERWEHYPDDDFKACCLEIFEREKLEGTELPAIIGGIREWLDEEESRRSQEHEAARSVISKRRRPFSSSGWCPAPTANGRPGTSPRPSIAARTGASIGSRRDLTSGWTCTG